jgi:catechol 2,3-dioxygenase-like lactoylglutathione lyase family enzyme
MTLPRIWSSAILLATVAAGGSLGLKIDSQASAPSQIPALEHTCLVTNDVKRLVDFYEPVLALKAKWSGQDYAEFPTSVGVLAIFSAEAQEKYIPGSAEAARNKSVILEFRVANVDQEYGRLQSLVKTWVKPPTTQPWGTRSVYFRDPDGNLLDFYTPAKAQ